VEGHLAIIWYLTPMLGTVYSRKWLRTITGIGLLALHFVIVPGCGFKDRLPRVIARLETAAVSGPILPSKNIGVVDVANGPKKEFSLFKPLQVCQVESRVNHSVDQSPVFWHQRKGIVTHADRVGGEWHWRRNLRQFSPHVRIHDDSQDVGGGVASVPDSQSDHYGFVAHDWNSSRIVGIQIGEAPKFGSERRESDVGTLDRARGQICRMINRDLPRREDRQYKRQGGNSPVGIQPTDPPAPIERRLLLLWIGLITWACCFWAGLLWLRIPAMVITGSGHRDQGFG